MSFIKKVIFFKSTFLNIFQRLILIISFVSIVAIYGVSITYRYFLKGDVFGLEELIAFPSFWLYFVGAGYASRIRNFHISTDIVDAYIGNGTIFKIVKLIKGSVTLFIAAVILYWSLESVYWTFSMNKVTPSLKIPEYIMQSSIIIGFALMLLYFSIQFIQDIISIFKNIK